MMRKGRKRKHQNEENYRAANDTVIAIHGKKHICGYIAEGTKIGIDVQIAEVKKTLGSVRRTCEAGN